MLQLNKATKISDDIIQLQDMSEKLTDYSQHMLEESDNISDSDLEYRAHRMQEIVKHIDAAIHRMIDYQREFVGS